MDRDSPLLGASPLGKAGLAAIIAVPSVFLLYFFAYPVASITVRSLTTDGSFSFAVIGDVLTDRSLLSVARFTVLQALISTVVTVVVAFPAAWAFAKFDFPAKRALRAATLVPFVLPTLVVGSAFLTIAGPNGAIGADLTGTLLLIVIAHAFYNYAIVVRGVGAYWERIDPRMEDAARTLGASAFTAFRTITLPLLRPVIASTSALVFLFSFTSFGVVLLLGDLKSTTIEVEIWRQTTAFLRLDVASTLAVLQLIGVGAILAGYGWFQRTTAVQFEHAPAATRRPRKGRERMGVAAALGSMAVILGTPLLLLVVRSFANPAGGFGIVNYQNLFRLPEITAAFVDPIDAIQNSFVVAFMTLAIAIVIGTLAAAALTYASRRVARSFDLFVMLPLGTSAVTIGFGFLIALSWPVDLRTSLILIPIAHALVAVPFVVRTTTPALGSVRHTLREAAAVLGASPWRTWWTIDLKIVTPAIIVAAAFAFAISMGEFGATSFITRPNFPTIPIAIFRLLGKPGVAPFGAAIALSVVLMVVTGVSMFVIDAIGTRASDEL
ncbi:MAG: iron ABC transporter permease [Actinomycetota bacterium]